MPGHTKKRRLLSWDEWYRLASEYRDEHGDLLVPKDYVCPAGQKLGRWIERQRAKYNGVPSVRGQLDRSQIALLNDLGMVWKEEFRHSWDDWLEMLDWYRESFGDADIPHNYKRGDYHLGNWLVEQRKSYAAGRLDARQVADLEARGVNWNMRTRPRSWEDWYEDAAAYYREHGDLTVTLEYRTPEGNRLGFWVYRQRDIFMGRKQGRALSSRQVELLDAIGMTWDPLAERPQAWEQMYRWIADYRAENGKLPLWPRSLKAPDGRSMWGWIRTQRQQLAEGKVSAAQRARLAELGIVAATRTAKEEKTRQAE